MLTVGVVSSDTKNSAALLAMLQQTGLVQPVEHWDLMSGDGPTTAASVPDVVLTEIGRDAKTPLEFAARLHRLNPAVCIIAISGYQEPGPDLLMQAMRSGVREFLSTPVDPMIVREMLERLVKQKGVPQSDTEKLIVILGAKGGVGTTTITVNLSVQLARAGGKKVALIDFGRPWATAPCCWIWKHDLISALPWKVWSVLTAIFSADCSPATRAACKFLPAPPMRMIGTACRPVPSPASSTWRRAALIM